MKYIAIVALLLGAVFTAHAEEATFSYTAYNALLHDYVNDAGQVDYRGLKANRAALDQFNATMARVPQEEYRTWGASRKIAFWINAYNAFTLTAIIDHYPIQSGGLIAGFRFPSNSIRQINGVWDDLEWQVMGMAYTLDQIEHEILRKHFSEPRIHMAIVCASVGCPFLRNEAYTGDELDGQLDEQSARFLADREKGMRADHGEKDLYLSPIFKWFAKDFTMSHGTTGIAGYAGSEAAVLNFVASYMDAATARWIKAGDYTLRYLDYDWSLNEQAP